MLADALLDWAYHFYQTLPGTAVASLSFCNQSRSTALSPRDRVTHTQHRINTVTLKPNGRRRRHVDRSARAFLTCEPVECLYAVESRVRSPRVACWARRGLASRAHSLTRRRGGGQACAAEGEHRLSLSRGRAWPTWPTLTFHMHLTLEARHSTFTQSEPWRQLPSA
eukprot:scaffold31116_cov74-Phaeocystis_antarctica.AAC.1